MRKQNLFFTFASMLVVFLILPILLQAVTDNSAVAPMKIDIFREEEKNISIPSLPVSTSGGLIKAEVMPINEDIISNTLRDVKKNLEDEASLGNDISQTLKPTTTIIAPTEIKSVIETAVSSSNSEQMKQVEVIGNTIKVEYAQPVKLLGFIPLKINLILTADIQSKKVEIKKPWWLFFANYNISEVKNQIENEIKKESVTSPTTVIAPIDTFSNIIKIFSNLTK
jgi:hypothetical protein